MFSNLRLTVYELVGYLVPGAVGCFALYVAAWTLFFPEYPLSIDIAHLNKEEWALILLIFYVCGHVMQAISNLYLNSEKRCKTIERCSNLAKQWAHEIEKSDRKNEPTVLDDKDMRMLANCTLTQFGSTVDQEIFLYREGFYKGTSTALFLLSIGLILRCFRSGTNILVAEHSEHLPQLAIVTASVICALSGTAFVMRYFRFCEYRLKNSLASAIVIRRYRIKQEKS